MKMKSIFLRVCVNQLRKIKSRMLPCNPSCEHYCGLALWPFTKNASSIPKDVPKGHLVVYVGENYKRFVISINLLRHPLFKTLLDQAQDAYDFAAHSKLCIPCDENIFLDFVQCVNAPRPRICVCS